jgi:signal transduction histidine kinase
MLMQHVQSRLTTEMGCVYVLEAANVEHVTLVPVACLDQRIMEPLLFDSDSPFVRHLAQHPHRPLAHYDVAALEAFANMAPVEKERLTGRQHELYVPLYAGDQWVGLMGLGNKLAGSPYNNQDFDWLEEISIPAGLLLAQARKLAAWRQRYEDQVTTWDYTLERNQHLEALHDLYCKFVKMITPELRRPVVVMSNHLRDSNEHSNGALQVVEEQLAALRLPLESLVAMAARLQKEDDFHFEAVYMGDVMRQVQNNLHTMARARRVEIEIDMPLRLPPVRGDEVRLVEAMQHVVHNAIKYNKIGGKVTIIGDVLDGELFVQVMDSGVGMPRDRLEQVWEAYHGNDHDRYGSNTPSMGLLFSRYIIEAHGGRIVADSEYGVGSTFAIYLPIPVAAGR